MPSSNGKLVLLFSNYWKGVSMMYNDALPPGITAENNKLRWSYAINLWKQPILLRPLVIVMAVFVGVVVVTATISGGFTALLWALGGGCAFTLLVVGLTYLIMGLIHRGQYIFLFEMDEKGVLHHTPPRQNKKARSLGVAAVIIGHASGMKTISDAGRNARNAGGSAFYSSFSEVKKVKAVRKHNLIRVHSPFVRNQIYASPEQYGFVWEYITSRCKGANINLCDNQYRL